LFRLRSRPPKTALQNMGVQASKQEQAEPFDRSDFARAPVRDAVGNRREA
jgi:hypothetical protein